MEVIPIAAATLFHVFVKSLIFPGSHAEFIRPRLMLAITRNKIPS